MAFRPYVPEYALRLLAGRGGEVPPFALREDAAVLLADIAGFTPMSAALASAGRYGAEELSDLLNDVFDLVTGLVAGHGGTVAKFAGDAVTAVFPAAPRAPAAAAGRAVRCALDLQAAMGQFRAVATAAGTFTLAMRAGIGAGRALLAVVGEPAVRLEHVVAGAALDRAAAAVRHAGRGQVAVDGALAARLGVQVAGRRGDAVLVAGLAPRPPGPAAGPPGEHPEAEGDEPLAAFLHPAIAERVRRGQAGLVNEHRTVTMAFVGLPDLADDPAAVEELQRYVAAALRTIARWDGHLRQLDVGDKGTVMVLAFGAPVRPEDHEERAVRCCLELLALPGGPFRAGVTTGVVWCGEVGCDSRREYAIVGHSVNLAARLMEAAAPAQLLIDHATWQRASGAAVGRRLRPVAVKGRSGVVNVWAVDGVLDRGDPPGRVGVPPLVGRRAELAAVHAAVGRVAAGHGGVLGLTGEAGIGKSRLAAEAVALAGALRVEAWAGACRSLGTTSSYLVWRRICYRLLGLDQDGPLERQRAALGARLGERAPLLAPVLNLPMPDSRLTGRLDPSTRAELLRSLLLELLRERSAGASLLLVLEDCHWIDGPSRTLLGFLARQLDGCPVLLLLTARPAVTGPDPFESVARLPRFSRLTLDELTKPEAVELVRQRIRQLRGDDHEPAHETVRRVVARAGGNPLYLEELVSLVHHQGGGGAAVDLPDSVQRVVMARIDQLGEPEKAVLKVASVLGRRFRASWIAGSYPAAGPPEEVAGHLERLDRLRLTPLLDAGAEAEYGFRHAITQEVAYESLTLRTREALHEGVGAYIERAYADRLSQVVEALAYHWGRTRRSDKQRVWFRAAAEAARAAFANGAAIGYYRRLLPLLAEGESGRVLLDLGGVCHLVGRWTEAERAYRRAMEIARTAEDRSLLAASHRELGDLCMSTQSYAEAISWLTLAADQFERLDDRLGLARTLDRLAYALIQQSSYAEAAKVAERHLAAAGDAGDPAAVSAALDRIGAVHAFSGDLVAAFEVLGRSLETAGAAGDRHGAAGADGSLGAAAHDHAGALARFQRALAAAQRAGRRRPAAALAGEQGEGCREPGEYDRAIRCVAHALRIAVELGDWTGVADRVASLAAASAAQGEVEAAERRFARAIEFARKLDAPHFLSEWLHDLAQLLAATGRSGGAEPLNAEALAVASRHGERSTELRARLLSLRLRLGTGGPGADGAAAPRPPGRERAAAADEPARHGPAWDADPAATALYRQLHERTPNAGYRRAYERLTGTLLPPGPPLPPPPVARPATEVDQLLSDVDQLLGQAAELAGAPR
ncbi:MAG TPA: AAA family ATPase [Actinomycetota bacterium]|jgi:class 3 adenylate cyclase/tetratricopeptide (TPR) repeat protein